MVSSKTKEEVWKMVNEQGMTVDEVATIRGCSRTTIVDYLSRYEKDRMKEEEPTPVESKEFEELEVAYELLMKEYSKEMKSKQKLMDSNRILRKERREGHRTDNSVGEYAKEITAINKKYGAELAKIELPTIPYSRTGKVGVVQISDWHANEIINLPNNQYDFEVLAKRAKKLADEAIFLFEAHGIKNVLLASTGDMLNSDRRLDELLNQAVNRSKATVLVQHILTQMILHLRKHFGVHIVSVLGNESRVGEDWHSSNNVVSDNYDFVIMQNIKEKFEFSGIDDVTFGSVDKMESIVEVNGQKWLLVHDTGRVTDKQKDTQSKIGSYYLKGTPIDFIIAGHIHASRATDLSARSASMAGSNEYNEHKMSLVGRAAQNLFIVGKNDRQSIVVDLQNVEGVDGYKIIDELKAYNAKSRDKLKGNTTIFKVVV